MPTRLSAQRIRERLEEAGWQLTELAGGPWIIYGDNGDARLCVMGASRLEAWHKAEKEAQALCLPATTNKA
jgi:hypothetical protein